MLREPLFQMRTLARATPLTLCRVALWGFICLLVTHTAADADLWGHLRFGLDMLASKSLHASDPYSFTADRAWVNHEWLAEVLMGGAYTLLGAPGLVLLKLTVIAVIALVLFAIAAQERAHPLARDLFVALVLFATYTRTQVVRPQLFSVALFCVVLYLLRESDRGRPRALWGVPVCFAAWVNLHGGWIVGLAALGVWMIGEAWQRWSGRRTILLAAVGLLSLGATLLNPYGYGLWQFLGETVRAERPDITDWKPLLQLPAAILVIESVLPLVAVVAVWQRGVRGKTVGRDLTVLTLLAVATVRVGRVDAFLQAAIGVLLAPQIISLLNRIDVPARSIFRRASLPVGAMTLLLAVYLGVTAVQNVRVVRVEGRWIPDRDAAMFLRDHRPGARVLTWFDWGEYALWHLSPSDIRVSMDGRRETVYSERVLADHHRFYEGHADMIDYPDRIGADHVWLPANFQMVDRLTERGWTKVLETEKSVVLARSGNPAGHSAITTDGPFVFPWP